MKCKLLILSIVGLTLLVTNSFATIKQVRVVNDTDAIIYIHKGGFSPSVRIMPGQWKIFHYPFIVIPPGKSKPITSSLLISSSGGRWIIKPNGYTFLSNPDMLLCLDYKSPEHAQKTGNRVWTIKRATGFDKGCRVKGYKQPWFQSETSN